MAGYKRLITYAYNYDAGTKKNSVGYARVEVIESELKVKLDVKVPSFSGKFLKLYFYKRIRGGLQSVLIDELPIVDGKVDMKVQIAAKDIGSYGLNLNELNGFILYYNASKCIVSDWKDQVLSKEELNSIESPTLKWVSKERMEASLVDKSNKKVEVETNVKEKVSEIEPQKQEFQLLQEAGDEHQHKFEQIMEQNIESVEVPQRNIATEGVLDSAISEVPVTDKEAQIDSQKRIEPYNELDMVKNIASKIIQNKDQNNLSQVSQGSQSNVEMNTDSDEVVMAADAQLYQSEDTQAPPLDGQNDLEASNTRKVREKPEVPFPWRDAPMARHILTSFPRVYPFEDGEIAECVKFEPKDIELFPKESWVLGNNSFLLHGFNNYHHLLFAKKQTRSGCLYLLMVPGIYNPREKYMARMFGFEYFKCAKRRTVRDGEFGYWYIAISF